MFVKVAERVEKCCKEHTDHATGQLSCGHSAKCMRWFDRACCKATQADLSEKEAERLISDFEKKRIAWSTQGCMVSLNCMAMNMSN
jgi:hypothetical protein